MPVKTFTCGQCGEEVTKRKSRLVNGKRICKSHEEAQEFAEEQRKKDLEKALRDRQWKKPSRTRRNYDVFDAEISPMKQLAAFAVLGQMHRERMERDALAREMMAHSFKAMCISTFLDVAMEQDVSMKFALAKTTRIKLDEKFKELWGTLGASIEAVTILKGIAQESTEGMPERLMKQLLDDPSSVHQILDEYEELNKKEEELRVQLKEKV